MISKVFKTTHGVLKVVPLAELYRFIAVERATMTVTEYDVEEPHGGGAIRKDDKTYDRHVVELKSFESYKRLVEESVWNFVDSPRLTDEPTWNVIEEEVLKLVNRFQLPDTLVEVMPFTYVVLDLKPESFVIKVLEKEDGTRLGGLISYKGTYPAFTLRSEMPKTSVTYKDLVEALRDTFKEMYSKETIAQPQSVEYFMGSFGFEFIQTLANRLGLPIPEKKNE